MSVTVILEMDITPGTADQVLHFLQQILPDTRSFSGCLNLDVRQNQEDPNNLLFIESWRSRSDYEKYLAWRTETGTMKTLGAFMNGPPSIRYFDNLEI